MLLVSTRIAVLSSTGFRISKSVKAEPACPSIPICHFKVLLFEKRNDASVELLFDDPVWELRYKMLDAPVVP